MKRNGQALVEFIIVLPVLIIIVLGIIDFGMIFYKKNTLENVLDDVCDLWIKTKDKDELNIFISEIDSKIVLDLNSYDNNSNELILQQSYEVLTPGLNLVLGNPYQIEVRRVIFNE